MPNKAKSQEDILRDALREILDRTNKEKARDPHAAIAGGILEIHDIANTALAEFDRTPKGGHGDATMREALEEARKFIATNKYGYFESRLLPKIDAALATPARNCDRFQTELDAQLAFLNDVWLISVEKETMLERDKFENWTEQMKTRYGRWLLAPAEVNHG